MIFLVDGYGGDLEVFSLLTAHVALVSGFSGLDQHSFNLFQLRSRAHSPL
jgi:hypothetical protein